MTVKELKKLLRKMPDDMKVLIPLDASEGFTGMFFTPCKRESGEIEVGFEDLSEEEIIERELLNNPPETEKSFMLVPCGFFEEQEEEEWPPAELN
jgi:hypothetical protein